MKNLRDADSCGTCKHAVFVQLSDTRDIVGCNVDRSTVKFYRRESFNDGFDSKWAARHEVQRRQICDLFEKFK